jgi:hypothetical protein
VSVSYHAYVVVGVRLSNLVKVEDFESEVTKYHPDTGKPYRVCKKSRSYFWCGRPMDTPAERDPSDWDLPMLSGLKVYESGFVEREDCRRYVVGSLIAKGDEDDVVDIPWEKAAQTSRFVLDLLTASGYVGKIGLFLVTSAG